MVHLITTEYTSLINMAPYSLLLGLFFSGAICHTCASSEEYGQETIHVDIGDSQRLKLTKADQSVLHPEIKVISIKGDHAEPKTLSTDVWQPSKQDIEAAHKNLYVDHEKLAVVRLAWNQEKKIHFAESGVVNGRNIRAAAGVNEDGNSSNRSDYIDIGRNITPSNRPQGNSPYVAEVVLVCDKEFGDLFNHDRQRILDYFVVYFWDVNMRYKTLPSFNLSFRINAIVVINSPSGQPFIEEARDEDGRADFNRILWRFSYWIYEQMGGLPKFDMAVAITSTQVEWGGGLAYYRTACALDHGSRRHWGTTVWNDDGGWGSLTVGSHELAHILSGPHDDDPNIPGGCDYRGYIMSGGNDDLRWFFSPCSDRSIGEFLQSDEASCLLRQDETRQAPAIPTDFSSVAAPTRQEQCRIRLQNSNAFTKEEDEGNCKNMKCWAQQDNGWYLIWTMSPVDNTPCEGGGRCFRGRCRPIGRVLQNVGTRQCVRASNPFTKMSYVETFPCPNPTRGATPLERFGLETSNSNGKFLNTPYSTPDGMENGDRCIYSGNSEGDGIWTDKCDYDNSWQGWNVMDRGNGQFMLQHRISGRCARQSGSYVFSHTCNGNDASFRWRFI